MDCYNNEMPLNLYIFALDKKAHGKCGCLGPTFTICIASLTNHTIEMCLCFELYLNNTKLFNTLLCLTLILYEFGLYNLGLVSWISKM